MNALDALDLIGNRAEAIALQPAFSEEVARRQNHPVEVSPSDPALLKELAKLIAYSQNARANQITAMVAAGGLEEAFGNFDVATVASADANHIREVHWKPGKASQLSVMRFHKKVDRIIGVAQAMQRLEKQGHATRGLLSLFPKRIREAKDIEEFWQHFDDLRARFVSARMPFFSQMTSLLHLLLHFGFDCVKPDKIVKDVATKYGLLVEAPTDDDVRDLVRLIQEYSLSRNVRPAVVDLYLLMEGRQTGVWDLIKPEARRAPGDGRAKVGTRRAKKRSRGK